MGNHAISCIQLHWILEYCRCRHIEPSILARDCPYPLEHLLDAEQQLTWSAYTDLISALGKFVGDSELRECGRGAWSSPQFRTLASIGTVLFDTQDQYLYLFGKIGYITQHFPITTSMEKSGDQQLLIRVSMKDGAASSAPFLTMLAGLMEGLTLSIGLPAARVSMVVNPAGGDYTVSFRKQGFLSRTLARPLHWIRASRLITREFAIQQAIAQRLAVTQNVVVDQQETISALQLTIDNVADIVWTMSRDGRLLTRNTAFNTLPGSSTSIDSLEDIIEPDDLSRLNLVVAQLLSSPETAPGNLEIQVQQDLAQAWLAVKVLPIAQNTAALCIAREISADRQLTDEVERRTKNFQTVLDAASDAVVSIDLSNSITYANPATCAVFGYSRAELAGRKINDLLPDALSNPRLREILHTKRAVSVSAIEVQGIRRNREVVPFQVSVAIYELDGVWQKTCILRDLSTNTRLLQERNTLESQLHAAQRVDAVGQLAGGIAHDFNNLLVAILGYTDLALQPGTGDNLTVYLSEIRQAGERGTRLTRKLLDFSRRQVTEPTLVEANELVRGVNELMTRLLPVNIEIRIEYSPEAIHLLADPGELEQVLVNLAVNARDAMPGGGTFTISVAKCHEPENPDFVVLAIADTGMGMDARLQQRIFEPLYTTKPEGHGTGLGLAVVQRIIEAHGGMIQIESAPGEGTQFRILLPSTTPASRPKAAGTRSAREANGETILVIEANTQVRDLARLMLTSSGYRVLEAADGEAGETVFFDNAANVDLVLLGLVLPKKGGLDVATSILERAPGTRVLFTCDDPDENPGVSPQYQAIVEAGFPIIPKPFGTRALRTSVRASLDSDQLTTPKRVTTGELTKS